VQLRPEARIALRCLVHTVELLQGRHERLGDVAAAVSAEATGVARAGIRCQANLRASQCGMRNAECGIARPRSILEARPRSRPTGDQFRIPHSALRICRSRTPLSRYA